MTRRSIVLSVVAVLLAVGLGAWGKKVAPVARPAPPPSATTGSGGKPPGPPQPVNEPVVVPPEPIAEDKLAGKSLDDLNRDSPLKPAFFELDSSDLSTDAQGILQSNAGVLKQFASWQITIEGHCDERGSAEYNLALGERRAIAARDYLVSLGIGANRIRTVSYGKEFPFEPVHEEAAWSKNRRAHFVITAK
jgi:peptidoglycan-associated lipoprotein